MATVAGTAGEKRGDSGRKATVAMNLSAGLGKIGEAFPGPASSCTGARGCLFLGWPAAPRSVRAR